MTTPNFESTNYNFREGNFLPIKYDFDPSRAQQWASVPIQTGVLMHTANQCEITSDNKLVVQMFDREHEKGFFVDHIGALYVRLLRSVKQDQFRNDAITCTMMGILAQDNRAESIHGFSESAVEKATPPNKTPGGDVVPALDEWIAIWHRISGQ